MECFEILKYKVHNFMKQLYLALIIIFVFCKLSTAQNIYLKIPNYFDKTIINHLVDSLQKHSVLKEYLIYQKPLGKDKIISYLFCKQATNCIVWMIYKDSILTTQLRDIIPLFSYKYVSRTGVVKEEDKLKFRPPLLSVLDNEVVIYYNVKNKTSFYFEYGNNVTTYEPLTSKEKYRKEWISLIRKSLL